MTSSRLRRRAVWSVPVATASVVAVAVLVPTHASASAHPALPTRSAAQLLAALSDARAAHFSGEVVETARLGLPALPGADHKASLTWQSLITGTHSARVWVDGPDHQRLALLGQLAESDVIHDGNDLWTYASDTGQTTHQVLAQPDATGGPESADPAESGLPEVALTPQQAADKALAAIDPTTLVTVDPTARVAGQKAYTLVFTPRMPGSTVHKVLIAIDAVHSVPLRVQVFGTSRTAAFETAFQSISYGRPAASVFRFLPPKGSLPSHGTAGNTADPEKAGEASTAGPKVLGSGWNSVLAFPAGDSGSPLASLSRVPGKSDERRSETADVVNHLTKHLPNGDRLLSTALVNVLLTSDGRAFIGAVSPDVLAQAAAGKLR